MDEHINVCIYAHIYIYIYAQIFIYIHTYILSSKGPAIVNIMRMVYTSMQHGSQGEWTGVHMCEQ